MLTLPGTGVQVQIGFCLHAFKNLSSQKKYSSILSAILFASSTFAIEPSEIMSTEKPKNTLGIPVAEFLEDVDDFMSKQTGTATEVLKAMDELRLKYKYMEQSQLAKKSKLNNQVPDIQNNLEVLRTLKDKYEKKADFETSYLLDSHVYSRAQITPGNTVGLWLGANVMLEYPIEEAMSLLSKNLENAKKNLKQVELDLDFIKEQTTTTEVNLARIYNWDVRKRQSAPPEDSANAAAEQSNE